jgi:hypothetical protein
MSRGELMTHEHAPTRIGAAAVDIGPGRGALIVRTGADHAGTELEISPAGDDAPRQHVWVLARGNGAYAAVFGSLPAGDYRVWQPTPDTAPALITVPECRVTELDLRSGHADAAPAATRVQALVGDLDQ